MRNRTQFGSVRRVRQSTLCRGACDKGLLVSTWPRHEIAGGSMILIVLSLLGSWAAAADLALDPESRWLMEDIANPPISATSAETVQDADGNTYHTVALASETQAKSFGNPDKIDVLVVTGGHHFDPEPFFAIFKGCDDITFVEYPLKDESEVFEHSGVSQRTVRLLQRSQCQL